MDYKRTGDGVAAGVCYKASICGCAILLTETDDEQGHGYIVIVDGDCKGTVYSSLSKRQGLGMAKKLALTHAIIKERDRDHHSRQDSKIICQVCGTVGKVKDMHSDGLGNVFCQPCAMAE